MAKLNLMKKVSTFGVAVALSAMMVPAVAMADEPTNSTTGPDNVVVVKWQEGGAWRQANVDLDALWDDFYADEEGQTTQDKIGALYKKGSSAFTVLGSDKYVPLIDIIGAASSGDYSASDVWDIDDDYIVFDVWNDKKDANNNVIGKVVETYTKYASGYTKAKLENCNNFCGGTTAQDLVVDEIDEDDNPAEYADGAVLALRSNTANITGANTAQQTLEAMTIDDPTNSPRLMWGHEDNNTAGNRFPSNIDVITICDMGTEE